MAEVTAPQAAEILSISIMTIHRRVDDGTLKARRQGIRRVVRIDVDDLKRFAQQYDYKFDSSLCSQYAK